MCAYVFFFFQAEDGIRDLTVTGVQTCALPISGKARRGVLTCGTGLGMAYVANRFPRVRAAVAWSPEIAELARKHNDANVLVLPSRFVSEEEGMEILHRWLDTGFEGGRHARRVAKIEP